MANAIKNCTDGSCHNEGMIEDLRAEVEQLRLALCSIADMPVETDNRTLQAILHISKMAHIARSALEENK